MSQPSGTDRGYVRFAALGDSATYGVGDPVGRGVRGWARMLTDALAQCQELSFCNLARTGASAADVRNVQLADALQHRPHLASVIVGLNDTMRSSWSPSQIRADLLHTAASLAGCGSVLLTARFHDHTRVVGLPGFLARPMAQRIDVLNGIYDEIHALYGGPRVDLAGHPDVYDRSFWSIDRLHPSPLGHRALAEQFATQLRALGVGVGDVEPAVATSSSRLADMSRVAREGAPWIFRRARDLVPATARTWLHARAVPGVPDLGVQ